jgi:hypothetical protein
MQDRGRGMADREGVVGVIGMLPSSGQGGGILMK